LIAYADSVVRSGDDLAGLRTELVRRLGPEAAGHAADTVAAFSGLVRVADGTGIPIDGGLAAVSVDLRSDLALDGYPGSENSPSGETTAASFSTVEALFDNRRAD
jgi:hypothetical protein